MTIHARVFDEQYVVCHFTLPFMEWVNDFNNIYKKMPEKTVEDVLEEYKKVLSNLLDNELFDKYSIKHLLDVLE